MNIIRIGAANINTTVGAIKTNTEKILKSMAGMKMDGCDIGVFQEMAVCGYPSEDLVQWQKYIDAQEEAINKIIQKSETESCIGVAYVVGHAMIYNSQVYNVASVIANGTLYGSVPKEELPTYDVFYDGRQFSAGIPNYFDSNKKFGDMIFDMWWGKTGVAICEDMWTASGPIPRRAYQGAELMINISASPWRDGVYEKRIEISKTRSADSQLTFVYVNQVGGNDSLVFDGGSFICQNGALLNEAPRWQEQTVYFDIDIDETKRTRKQNTTWRNDYKNFILNNNKVNVIDMSKIDIYKNHVQKTYEYKNAKQFYFPVSNIKMLEDPHSEKISAICLGLEDYFNKIGAFNGIGIALSGGRDSMLTAILSYLWAKKYNKNTESIYCYSMPTRYNSETTKTLSRQLCEILNLSFNEYSIEEAYNREKNALEEIVDDSMDKKEYIITLQNVQARIRGMRMWNISNAKKLLWLQTGNMSEKATGYTTIGGDIMGGYSLIGNMSKCNVNDMLNYISENTENNELSDIIMALQTTLPSAELTEDQEDERDLMPFEILDSIYGMFVLEKRTPDEIYEILSSEWTVDELNIVCHDYKKEQLADWIDVFISKFFNSIYKWTQAPQSIHLGVIDLDRERALQIPVVQSTEWLSYKIWRNEVE